MQKRFFYHSFPRRASAGDIEAKGLAILRSMATSGLLLTPEKTVWSEFRQDGTRSEPIEVFQKRACFTELAPVELEQHATQFGQCALEFEIENLRLLGAVPVFYLPSPGAEERALGGIAAALIARMAEVQLVLVRLADIARLVAGTPNKNELINVTLNGKPVDNTRATIGAAEDLLRMLSHQTQPVDQLVSAFRALSGFFYPTENVEYTSELAYYRQREWRILSAMVHRGQEISRALTEGEMATLIELDSEFFNKQLRFPSGVHRRVEQCRYMTEVDRRPFLAWCSRIVVPDRMVASASELLWSLSIPTPVVPSSTLNRQSAA